jgi:hypothetical protein
MSMHMQVALIDFIKHDLEWKEVCYIYRNGWTTVEELQQYAAYQLKERLNKALEHKLVNFLICNAYEVNDCIEEICQEHESYQLGIDKVLKCLFSIILEKADELDETLDMIEEIYCDLGHPSELAIFIRYMPCNSNYRGSIKHISELKERLAQYIEIKSEQIETGLPFEEINWI